MTLRHYDVTFGITVQVQAKDEHDALTAAATLVRADPGFYCTKAMVWEGDQDGKIASTPDEGKETT